MGDVMPRWGGHACSGGPGGITVHCSGPGSTIDTLALVDQEASQWTWEHHRHACYSGPGSTIEGLLHAALEVEHW